MKRQISHEQTGFIKLFFACIGVTPLALLPFLWDSFYLTGIQSVNMIGIVLLHMVTCLWYTYRFNNLIFDDHFLYRPAGQAIKKIKLGNITKVLPLGIPFPVISGKVYLVNIHYIDNGESKKISFVSKPVMLRGSQNDIPFLIDLKEAITKDKFESF